LFPPSKLFLSPMAVDQSSIDTEIRFGSLERTPQQIEWRVLFAQKHNFWRHCLWFKSVATANTMKWIFTLPSAESSGPEDKATRKLRSRTKSLWKIARYQSKSKTLRLVCIRVELSVTFCLFCYRSLTVSVNERQQMGLMGGGVCCRKFFRSWRMFSETELYI